MTWLEICGKNRDCSATCPYGDGSGEYEDRLCREDLMADALDLLKEQEYKDRMFHALEDDWKALLKEQEAVEPVTQSSVYDPDTWFFVCGSCKKGVIERGDKFCRWCGQAVKWDA